MRQHIKFRYLHKIISANVHVTAGAEFMAQNSSLFSSYTFRSLFIVDNFYEGKIEETG